MSAELKQVGNVRGIVLSGGADDNRAVLVIDSNVSAVAPFTHAWCLQHVLTFCTRKHSTQLLAFSSATSTTADEDSINQIHNLEDEDARNDSWRSVHDSWCPWQRVVAGTVHKFQLFSHDFARQIIEAAENHAACSAQDSPQHFTGWTMRRHDAYQTCDLPLSFIPAIAERVFAVLTSTLLPAVAGIYGLKGGLSVRDVFVVKYDATVSDAQVALEMHEVLHEYAYTMSTPRLISRTGSQQTTKKLLRQIKILSVCASN